MKKIGICFSIVLIVLIVFYFMMLSHQSKTIKTAAAANSGKEKNNKPRNLIQGHLDKKEVEVEAQIIDESHLQRSVASLSPAPKTEQKKKSNEQSLLTYEIDDGLAVIHGDLIIGEVSRDEVLKSLSGSIKEPSLRIWPTNEIPIFIQPNLPNPERVNEALAYFAGTNVHFVPYANQEDAIVFESGGGACKSYLGYIGGKQPIFLSEACSSQAIAHEIMHALGFLHEQNRTDRDEYLDIVWANIDSRFNINFEKFSSSMMKVSGLTKFDFESIMLYPPTMFSSNGQITLKSKVDGQAVAPRQGLSAKDMERINKIY
ncbi:MAG: M12 family metallopeptidase [Bdellovibrionaceae bacterium]|nr:M12 family metallopeptidase [Pseudobdellovibrionaceae bacterium]